MFHDERHQVDYQYSNEQFLHCKIKDRKVGENFLLTSIYGDPKKEFRNHLWSSLKSLAVGIDEPCLLLGDFNAYLEEEDKKGGARANRRSMYEFHSCIQELGLIPLQYVGDRLTWFKGDIKERLDWAFCNIQWMDQLKGTKVSHLLRYGSDHRPIRVAEGEGRKNIRNEARFRYNLAWEYEDAFHEVLEESWKDKEWVEGTR